MMIIAKSNLRKLNKLIDIINNRIIKDYLEITDPGKVCFKNCSLHEGGEGYIILRYGKFSGLLIGSAMELWRGHFEPRHFSSTGNVELVRQMEFLSEKEFTLFNNLTLQ